ncbi:hypothetical protein [Ferruginibacter sp.]|nr:hypothetical protein [Ferruginibacter sp.]
MEIKTVREPVLVIRMFEDSAVYALGIKAFLQTGIGHSIDISVYSTEAVYSFKASNADCCLVLYHVPGEIKLPRLKKDLLQIKKRLPQAKIILYGIELSETVLDVFYTKAVKGYFLLSDAPERVAEVVNEVLKGNITISDNVKMDYVRYKADLHLKKRHKQKTNQFSLR